MDTLGTQIKIISFEPLDLTEGEKRKISADVSRLTERAWGKFTKDFVVKHAVENSLWVVLAYDDTNLIGYSSISAREISARIVYYIEFTIVDPRYQGRKVGPRLTAQALKKIALNNIVQLLYPGIEVMFLTPNIRALAKAAQHASFIYPNPYMADNVTGKIAPADDTTYAMATELIKKSDNPNRTIDREGLVLHDSYRQTPWLLYKEDTIPWHRNEKLNSFARKYLGYGKGLDREVIVRMKITLWSFLLTIF